MRDRIRQSLRKQGFFMTGTVSMPYGPDVVSSVSTNEREVTRDNVPTNPSDSNYTGLTNLFLTREFGDLPSPAGTHPWLI